MVTNILFKKGKAKSNEKEQISPQYVKGSARGSGNYQS